MKSDYYTLPLSAKSLIGRKIHESCNMTQSISHYIHLINTSYFGECTFDETFGCSIWNVDFDNLKNTNRLKDYIQDSLYESLARHEKRLHELRVSVKIKQQELFGAVDSNRIKKKIDITIKAKVKKTNEVFTYVEYFYMGPLSY